MRVMTWNLWWRFGDHWRARQDRILATLQELQTDIIGLQEVWVAGEADQADVLASQLGMHAAAAAPSLPPPPQPPESPDQAGVEVGVAVLSRWPIIATERRLLPSGHRPEVVALAVTADHPAGPLHMVVSCIDWEPELADRRLAQARSLAALATDPGRHGPLPVFLTGDLNSPPTTPEIRLLTGVMTDAWAAARPDDPGPTLSTTNRFAPREARHLIDQRIDYIFARPGTSERTLEVTDAFLAGQDRDDLPPSDHHAVVADFML